MPKNNKKRKFIHTTNIWTCALCNKDIKTINNQKLANMKIRLHKQQHEREGCVFIGETIEPTHTKRHNEIGGGFNIGHKKEKKIE